MSDLISSSEVKSQINTESTLEEVRSTIDPQKSSSSQKESREEQDMEVSEDPSASKSKASSFQAPVEQFVMATMDHNLSSEISDQPKKKRKTESESSENLLDFAKGDVIKVIQKDESGWWWGQKYQVKTKTLYGKCGWFPSTYVKEYFTTIIPTKVEDPVLQSLSALQQYPADWYSYCYTTGLKPQEAAAAMAGADPSYRFKGQPLLENVKEDPEQITKEIRVMNQFFDYESWNDRMNKLDPSKRKGRPNPKLKKRKRINW